MRLRVTVATVDPRQDTRGIVAPTRMMQHVRFARFPTPEPLTGLVDWYWLVEWDLPPGRRHPQQVLSHPAVNISVGVAPPPGVDPPPGPYPLRTMVNGVDVTMTTRTLSGRGWNLAAKTTTGGFGAWVDDVRTLNGAFLPLRAVMDEDGDALARRCAGDARDARDTGDAGSARSAMCDAVEDGSDGDTDPCDEPRAPGEDRLHDVDHAVRTLDAALLAALVARPAERIALSREVARIAAVAERDRSVRRVGELARLAGVTTRTLQRMFASCAGVSPTYVVRRFRLLDAAEMVRDGQSVEWASIAHQLGYADQAHLTRDFTASLGRTPAAYARECATADPTPPMIAAEDDPEGSP